MKIIGVGILIALLFTGVAFQQIRSRVLQAHYQFLANEALSVARSLALRLEENGTRPTEAQLKAERHEVMAAFPAIQYLIVEDRKRRVVAQNPTSLQERPSAKLEVPYKVKLPSGELRAYRQDTTIIFEVTVPIDGDAGNTLRLGMDDSIIARELASINQVLLLSLLLGVLASLCFAFVVVYLLNRPLRALLHTSRQVQDGNLTARSPIYSNDEIGRLAVAFNQLTEELAESREHMLRADKLASIGEFAAGIAHEINNPLDGVMSCLSRLQRDPANLTQNMEYLQMIQKALKRVSAVIQRLLEYARTRDMHFEPADMHAVIENVVALVNVMARQSGVDIEYDFGENVPMVLGDRYHLEQALLNLALNSLAAMPQAGTLTFRTRAQRSEDTSKEWVEIKVVDTGTGIPPENLSRIFEPFFTTKDPGKGTGLGLAMVREIVEAHHGTIDVESTVEIGTTVCITLPTVVPGIENTDGTTAADAALGKVEIR